MEIEGVWFPSGSSKRVAARLLISSAGYILKAEGRQPVEGRFDRLEISNRIGNIPRKIILPDQSVFETVVNDEIDHWISGQGKANEGGWIHRLESRWRWIAIALVAVVITVYSGARWGLPWVSQVAARHMPQTIVESISDGSLDFLDATIFDPSGISEHQQARLTQRFNLLRADDSEHQYVLLFRKLGVPNALALPSGDLLVTDKFAELATGEEFDAVMLHEIGHVEKRHGLQQLVRSSLVSFVIAMFVGDPSGVGELVVALPTFLLQSHYSRKHEAEADEFAFDAMIEKSIDPIHFATIMEKMENFKPEDVVIEDSGNGQGHDPDTGEGLSGYLSSHPATIDRINKAKQYSRQFRQSGLGEG